jgi:hypothetical protein
VTSQAVRRRRNPEHVLGLAAVVGLASGLIVAIVALLLIAFIQALNEGAGIGHAYEALAITDAEDWELIPMFLAGATVIGAVTSIAAVTAWWEITTRSPGRPWVARLGGAAIAAVLPLLLIAATLNWSLAVPVAVAAAITAAIAAPSIGYERPGTSPAPPLHT